MAGLEIGDADYNPVLSAGMTCRVDAANSAPGSIDITYPLDGVQSDNLAAGLIVHAKISNDAHEFRELAPYVLRHFRVDLVDAQPVGHWTGVQHGWDRLRKTLTHHNYFPVGIEPYDYLAGTPLRIMALGVFEHAAARNSLKHVGCTPSDPDGRNDADGLPWLADYDQTIPAPWNMTAEKVLDIMVEDVALEWDLVRFPPSGPEDDDIWSYLRLYNPGNLGKDRTSVAAGNNPVLFETGQYVSAAPLNQDGIDQIDRVLAYNRKSVTVIVEREGLGPDDDVAEVGLYLPDVKKATVLRRRATRHLNRRNKVLTDQSLALQLVTGVPVPGVDVQVGDWVDLVIAGAKPTRRRLDSWGVTLEPDGQVTADVVLGTTINTRSIRVHRGLSDLQRVTTLLQTVADRVL